MTLAGGSSVPQLHGRFVRMRPVVPDDIPVLSAILAEPEVAAWWRRSDWERVDWEGTVTFAIESDGSLVGCVQYVEEADPDYYSASIDIFVSKRAQGRGLGSDAMRTLVSWLIDERGHHRITVDPALANERAMHVYAALGFKPVGVLRRYERVTDDDWRDALLMDLIADEFVRE